MRRLSAVHGPGSARVRIVGWIALVVAVALVTVVVVVGRVALLQARADLDAELHHEGQKLHAFAARGVDTATGGSPTRVDAVLDAFLRDNLPDEDETFFSVVDGVARSRSPQAPLARVDLDAQVVAAAASARTPRAASAQSSAGPIRYAVFPVRVAGDRAAGALVAVEFAEPGRAQAWRLVRLVAVVAFAALVLALAVAWVVAGRVLGPIRVLRMAADDIGETGLGTRIAVTGDDEVAALAGTFNRMLDRLETAFDGQRRFLDDASHELRTPLTVVRGHVELMLEESPEDRVRTRALVLDELDRMTRLVDDLLLLASADDPGFLRTAPVDLADLVVEVAAKARPLGRRRWTLDELAEVTLVADGQRLTQALLQLAANAVEHTASEDVVAFGVAARGDEVHLWVRDTGTGIDPADQADVFDRAVQGTTRPGGGRKGLGLGLSIVSSIVRAHGGAVRLDSALGVGSRFTVVLPRDRGVET